MYQQWEITIPELTGDEPRNAYIYVPDGAVVDDERRYPVLYMFDGQNLFRDADASFGKSWGLLEYVTGNNIPLIIAAIECSHHDEQDECGGRLSEYSPFDFDNSQWGKIRGRGRITMDYIVNEFKPFIDENFPTLPQREYTFIGGSSMGGLMTIYALMAYNHYFSRGAALSPSLGFCRHDLEALIDDARIGKTVLYMDYGSREMRRIKAKQLYGDMSARLIAKGVYLTSRVVPGGNHSEESWERQVPFFLSTILYDL